MFSQFRLTQNLIRAGTSGQ